MIIADTGFWVALLDQRDGWHLKARTCLAGLHEPLITTLPVVTEVCYLLQTRRGTQQTIQFLRAQQAGLFKIFTLEETDFPRLAALIDQYASLPMDLADASLVILAEALGHGRIVSTDQRDFLAYRWKNQYPFSNLLSNA